MFDVLNTAVMGKKKDLSGFDKGQIVIARRFSGSISEIAWLSGLLTFNCSEYLSTVVQKEKLHSLLTKHWAVKIFMKCEQIFSPSTNQQKPTVAQRAESFNQNKGRKFSQHIDLFFFFVSFCFSCTNVYPIQGPGVTKGRGLVWCCMSVRKFMELCRKVNPRCEEVNIAVIGKTSCWEFVPQSSSLSGTCFFLMVCKGNEDNSSLCMWHGRLVVVAPRNVAY